MATKALTLNCNGLRQKQKRNALFKQFKKSKYAIVCLQETFVLKQDIETWEKEWKGQLFAITGTCHSKGQVILFHKSFVVSDLNVNFVSDRILLITFKHEVNGFVNIKTIKEQR